MIVLAAGMPRAGSGWHYNLIHDLMGTAGSVPARQIRTRYRLERILTDVNCNIGVLSARRLAMVLVPALQGKTFVIKAHAGPTASSRLLSRLGFLRVSYIYRDPRDAMLSAHESGRRALERGHPNAFSHLMDFRTSLDFVTQYVQVWEKWIKERGVHITRYEDLLTNYDAESASLATFLGLEWSRAEVGAVIDRFRPRAAEGQPGLHFHKGQIGRFREVYTREQQSVLHETFGGALALMGYPG